MGGALSGDRRARVLQASGRKCRRGKRGALPRGASSALRWSLDAHKAFIVGLIEAQGHQPQRNGGAARRRAVGRISRGALNAWPRGHGWAFPHRMPSSRAVCLLILRVGARGRHRHGPSGSESRSAGRDFLVGSKARGPKGVKLVVSDYHACLVAAIGEVIPDAAWRCRWRRNGELVERTRGTPRPTHPASTCVEERRSASAVGPACRTATGVKRHSFGWVHRPSSRLGIGRFPIGPDSHVQQNLQINSQKSCNSAPMTMVRSL